jgi:hypothetical protein
MQGGMKYQKRPIIIEAQQLTRIDEYPNGVCSCRVNMGRAHVHTIRYNQAIAVNYGDWIVAEPDGEHFYPITDEIFRSKYELVSEP